MEVERESDLREVVQTAAYVVEAEELVSIVQRVVETEGKAAPAVFHRFSVLVS